MKLMVMQREIQMAINVARARDQLQICGTVYSVFASGIMIRAATGASVPGIAGVPLIGGGIALSNLFDMAYGTKMVRVRREAEAILGDERERARLFVPPRQAPFFDKYEEELKTETALFGSVGPVGAYWPSFLGLAVKGPPEK